MDGDRRDDARWWPVTEVGQPPMRAIELCCALLGPHFTHRLAVALKGTTDNPITDPFLVRFREDLEGVDGRPPEMLLLLASAMGEVHRNFMARFADGDTDDPYHVLRRRLDETYKLLGWLTVEAVQQFGWTETTFLEYCELESGGHYGAMQWPPAGAAYTRRPPDT